MCGTEKQHILVAISNLKVAGAQKVVEQLAVNMNKDRYIVSVLVIGKAENTAIEKRLENAGISICYLNKPRGFHPGILKCVNEYVLQFSPSIIHTHLSSWIYMFPAAIRHRIKILHTIHSRPKRQESTLAARVLISILYHLKIIIPVAISDEIKKEAACIYNMPQKQIEMVYNPVDYRSFSVEPKRMHEEICIVNVARFNKVKNQLFLIEAFSKAVEKNKNIRLVIAGEGELLEQAKARCTELHIQDVVEFAGNVENVPKLLAECDIFVLPSLHEGLPISLLEAEAAGLPVIASRVGGIVDIVRDNGYLIDVNDEPALVSAMLDLAANETVRSEMGEKSRQIAKQYSADVITRRYEELFEKYGRM